MGDESERNVKQASVSFFSISPSVGIFNTSYYALSLIYHETEVAPFFSCFRARISTFKKVEENVKQNLHKKRET